MLAFRPHAEEQVQSAEPGQKAESVFEELRIRPWREVWIGACAMCFGGDGIAPIVYFRRKLPDIACRVFHLNGLQAELSLHPIEELHIPIKEEVRRVLIKSLQFCCVVLEERGFAIAALDALPVLSVPGFGFVYAHFANGLSFIFTFEQRDAQT